MRTATVITLSVVALWFFTGCENSELTQCQKDNAALQQQVTQARKKLASQKQATEKMVNIVMGRASACEKELKAARAQNQQTAAQLQDTQKQLAAAQQRIAALQDQLDQSKQAIQAAAGLMKQEEASLKKQISDLRAANKKLQEQVRALTDELTRLKAAGKENASPTAPTQP